MAVVEKILDLPAGRVALAETSGEGPALLMLHGLGLGKEVFGAQLNSPLADHFRMIAIDLPGHGGSSDAITPELTYTMPAIADHCAAVLGALNIPRATVFGWSLGGHIAIQMLKNHPDRLSGVMLTGAPPFGRGPLAALRAFHTHWDMLLASKTTYTDRDALRFERLCFGEDARGTWIDTIRRADGQMRSLLNRSLMRADGGDQKQIVEETPLPVAIVNGANDPIVRVNYLETLHYRNLWEGKCHVLPNAGHAPFATSPHAFNALLHRFVTSAALAERPTPQSRSSVRSA